MAQLPRQVIPVSAGCDPERTKHNFLARFIHGQTLKDKAVLNGHETELGRDAELEDIYITLFAPAVGAFHCLADLLCYRQLPNLCVQR